MVLARLLAFLPAKGRAVILTLVALTCISALILSHIVFLSLRCHHAASEVAFVEYICIPALSPLQV